MNTIDTSLYQPSQSICNFYPQKNKHTKQKIRVEKNIMNSTQPYFTWYIFNKIKIATTQKNLCIDKLPLLLLAKLMSDLMSATNEYFVRNIFL